MEPGALFKEADVLSESVLPKGSAIGGVCCVCKKKCSASCSLYVTMLMVSSAPGIAHFSRHGCMTEHAARSRGSMPLQLFERSFVILAEAAFRLAHTLVAAANIHSVAESCRQRFVGTIFLRYLHSKLLEIDCSTLHRLTQQSWNSHLTQTSHGQWR